MTRIHDMGGRFGDGPVMPDDAGAAVFTKEWHGRALALTLAAGALGRWNIDASRHMRECLPPADYAGFGYYEKWLAGLANLLVAQGIVSIDEIAAGKALTEADTTLRDRCLAAAAVVPTLQRGGPSARPTDTPPRFAVGDAVMTRTIAENRNIAGGHTRLPAYAAGAVSSCCSMVAMCFRTAMRISTARHRNIFIPSALPLATCGSMPSHPMTPSVLIFGTAISSRHDSFRPHTGRRLRYVPPRRGQAFSHPWHAEVFALVISLHDAGLFSWQEWADMLAQSWQRCQCRQP